jgi:ankyrin repeat protein
MTDNSDNSDNDDGYDGGYSDDYNTCFECAECKKEVDKLSVGVYTKELIFAACEVNDIYIVQCLIKRVSDINVLNVGGWSLLGMACYHGYTNIIQLLLSQPNINVNGIGRCHHNIVYTPLHLCCETDQVCAANILLTHPNIDVNKKGFRICVENNTHIFENKTSTPFQYACFNKSMDVIFALLERRDLKIYSDKCTTTILCDTFPYEGNNIADDTLPYEGNSIADDTLPYEGNNISYNISYEREDERGDEIFSFLDVIVGYGFSPEEQHLSNMIIDVFMDREDVRPDLNDDYFLLPILDCIEYGKFDIVEHMIKKITNVNNNISVNTGYKLISILDSLIGVYGESQLDNQTRRYTQQRLIDYILTIYKKQINKTDRYGQTLLHLCCENGDYYLINKLLTVEGIDVNIQDNEDKTALHICVNDRNPVCTACLLHRADINLSITDQDGYTVVDDIYYALMNEIDYDDINCEENESIFSIADGLLSHPNVDVTVKYNKTSTLLHIACYNHLNNAIKALLTNPKIDVNAKDRFNSTALMEFCRCDWSINDVDNNDIHIDTLKLLLTTPNIDLNASCDNYHTVLFFATDNRNREILKYLLAAGAYLYDKTNLHLFIDPHKVEGYRLIEYYNKNPSLLLKYKVEVDCISKVFASVVLLCDDYFTLKSTFTLKPTFVLKSTFTSESTSTSESTFTLKSASRFYEIARKLPMDLQMLLCHRLYRSTRQNVNGKLFLEQAKIILNSHCDD